MRHRQPNQPALYVGTYWSRTRHEHGFALNAACDEEETSTMFRVRHGEATPACSNMIKLDTDEPACLNLMKSDGGMENVDPLQVRTQPPQPRRI